jgi:dipeptidyl-peptidase 4
MSQLSYPRHAARTQRFTLGMPRSFEIVPSAQRILFLRSGSGTDRVNRLWVLDLGSMEERLLVDPHELLGGGDEDLPPEERARRERVRESAGGIVSFTCDADGETVVFSLSGRTYVVDVAKEEPREIEVASPGVDPRISPDGRRVAYVHQGALRVHDLSSGEDRSLVEPDGSEVTWGLAEFVAGEEMSRTRGFWWSPDGHRLLVERADIAPVQRWHIADPANPDRLPHEVAYPAAGTPNADVTLWIVDLDGRRIEVTWDRETFEYLNRISWTTYGPPVIQVMSRDQRRSQILSVGDDGETAVLQDWADEAWIELMSGVPALLPDGRLLHFVDDMAADTRSLSVDGEPVTPPDLQVRGVISVGEEGVVFSGSEADATELHVYRWRDGRTERLSPESGLHGASAAGDLAVLVSRSMERTGATVGVFRNGEPVGEIPSLAEKCEVVPRVRLAPAGERRLNAGLLLPSDETFGKLPVILDPYGGPHAQRAVAALGAYTTSQWLADQGFAVIVADGRGSPGRGPVWEKSIVGDLASHALDDQIEALQALAEEEPRLDLSRVGIRGASFGGFLSALAVLRRPDVFHAAVATASVTDWRLYDTFYTERYLGLPQESPEAYAQSSLLDDAPKLERPLLLVHGLADDNVVVAHTLRLSGALLAAGKTHQVLPLTGITHMTAPDEVVAENLLMLEVDFFRTHLG